MNRHLKNRDQNAEEDFSEIRELLRAALPEPAASELAQVRQALSERLAAEPARPSTLLAWSTGVALLATLLIILFSWRQHSAAPVSPVQENVLQLAAAPALARHLVLPAFPGRERHSGMRTQAGMRDAALLFAANGDTQLRIRTQDPNVVILLPLSENTDEKTN